MLQIRPDKLCLQLHISKHIFLRVYVELLPANISPPQRKVAEEPSARSPQQRLCTTVTEPKLGPWWESHRLGQLSRKAAQENGSTDGVMKGDTEPVRYT